MEKIPKPRRIRMGEEGEMGVGTLLIFIAMILVAAVAAGVLVQTAYELQQQAEATGDQALQEVATGLRVVAIYGMTNNSSGALVITDLYLKVALTAGSPVINLATLIIEISNGEADETLSCPDYAVASTDGTFDVASLRDTYPDNIAAWTAADVGITQGDVALLHIDLAEQLPTDMSLVTQQDATILLIPKHGIPTYVLITTPSVLSNTYEILT